jgi:hypothetical protein
MRFDQAIEAVFETNALDPAVTRALDNGADDGVQAGRVATTGEHTNPFRSGHGPDYSSLAALRGVKAA